MILYYDLSKINKFATIFRVKCESWKLLQDSDTFDGWSLEIWRFNEHRGGKKTKQKQQWINMKTDRRCQRDGSKHRESQLFNWRSRRESFDWRAILHDALSVASKRRQDVDSPHVWEFHGAVHPQWRRRFPGISPGEALLWFKTKKKQMIFFQLSRL